MTKEQVLGYVIAAVNTELSYLDTADKVAFIMNLERQFETLPLEEAEQIYQEQWGRYE